MVFGIFTISNLLKICNNFKHMIRIKFFTKKFIIMPENHFLSHPTFIPIQNALITNSKRVSPSNNRIENTKKCIVKFVSRSMSKLAIVDNCNPISILLRIESHGQQRQQCNSASVIARYLHTYNIKQIDKVQFNYSTMHISHNIRTTFQIDNNYHCGSII